MSRNRASTVCECGLDFEAFFAGADASDPELVDWNADRGPTAYPLGHGYREPLSVYRSDVEPPSDAYRWKHVRCPLCRRHMGLWYVRQRDSDDEPAYRLYDTSFWHARNDEPAREDVAGALVWTARDLEEAVALYVARRAMS